MVNLCWYPQSGAVVGVENYTACVFPDADGHHHMPKDLTPAIVPASGGALTTTTGTQRIATLD